MIRYCEHCLECFGKLEEKHAEKVEPKIEQEGFIF
jgi:uncharacterized protein with PIN domain